MSQYPITRFEAKRLFGLNIDVVTGNQISMLANSERQLIPHDIVYERPVVYSVFVCLTQVRTQRSEQSPRSLTLGTNFHATDHGAKKNVADTSLPARPAPIFFGAQ